MERRTEPAHAPPPPSCAWPGPHPFSSSAFPPAPHAPATVSPAPVPGRLAHRGGRIRILSVGPSPAYLLRSRKALCRSSAPPWRWRPCHGRRRPAGLSLRPRAWRARGLTMPTSLTIMTTQGTWCGPGVGSVGVDLRRRWDERGVGLGGLRPPGLFFLFFVESSWLGTARWWNGRRPAATVGAGGGAVSLLGFGCWPAPAAFRCRGGACISRLAPSHCCLP